MRTPILASVLTALAAAACVDGVDVDLGVRTDGVIGGTLTPDGMYPGIGALLYSFGNGPQTGCTGTLITPTVVLTAAHCVDPQLGGDFLVGFTLAHDTLAGPPPMTAVARKLMHEQFSLDAQVQPGLGHWFDIGLVFLATPITEVAPVLLPRPEDALGLLADSDLHIVGYGRISNATDDVGVKYDAATKLVSLNDWELQVSAGQGQPQNCHGDSGGPALAELAGTRVVGVVSRSFDLSSQCVNGGVDTRVDAYLEWIFAQGLTDAPCGSGLAEACPVEEEDDSGGCCSTSGEAPLGSAAMAGVVAMLVGRRRRRQRQP